MTPGGQSTLTHGNDTEIGNAAYAPGIALGGARPLPAEEFWDNLGSWREFSIPG